LLLCHAYNKGGTTTSPTLMLSLGRWTKRFFSAATLLSIKEAMDTPEEAENIEAKVGAMIKKINEDGSQMATSQLQTLAKQVVSCIDKLNSGEHQEEAFVDPKAVIDLHQEFSADADIKQLERDLEFVPPLSQVAGMKDGDKAKKGEITSLKAALAKYTDGNITLDPHGITKEKLETLLAKVDEVQTRFTKAECGGNTKARHALGEALKKFEKTLSAVPDIVEKKDEFMKVNRERVGEREMREREGLSG